MVIFLCHSVKDILLLVLRLYGKDSRYSKMKTVKMFLNDTMKDIKRTVRKHGWVLGHRRGVHGTEILGYVEAKPLSHAYLVKAYAEELYPFDDPEK